MKHKISTYITFRVYRKCVSTSLAYRATLDTTRKVFCLCRVVDVVVRVRIDLSLHKYDTENTT